MNRGPIKEKTMLKKIFSYQIVLCVFSTLAFAVEMDTSYSVKWSNTPWGGGGLIPAGPPWNMVGPFDFDGDGFGDFVVSSSYAGEFCNGVYHYEAAGNDSLELKWVYTFYDLSCSYDAYSSVAVGDIDGDGNQEILSLVDTSPGISGQKGFQVFEWSPDSLSFLSQPTYTWDMGLDSVWEASQIYVEDLDNDSKEEIIVSVMDGPWSQLGLGGTSRLMIFELESATDDSAIFNIEYIDEVWSNWSGYNISVGDLDNDGLNEIYTVGYEYFHLIIHESTGEDEYAYQTDFYISSELYERANQGIVVADIDANGENEMICLTSGVNSLAGELLTPGSFFIASGVGDVSSLSYSNFNLFSSYDGGLRQVAVGDADGDGSLNIYLAGHYDEAVYDWEYGGGDPMDPNNYVEKAIFMDDTTDNFTPGNDQGRVRVAKLFTGDIDNDGSGDIVFTSASFAADKPHLYMIEHSGILGASEENPSIPNKISISQNYPNPFNPETRFQYYIPVDGIVLIKVYDILGKKIKTLVNQWKSAGVHNEIWSGQNDNNQMVSSGVYFYQVKVGDEQITKKMILSK